MTLLERLTRILDRQVTATTIARSDGEKAALRLIEEGQSAERAGQRELALNLYQSAVAAAPQLSKAHMNLGNAYLSVAEVEKALVAYETSVQLDPHSAPAQYNLGNARWHMNQPEAALRAYRSAAQLDPGFVHPWIAIANTLGGLGRLDEAIAACRHALQVDPGSAEARFVLSIVFQAAGRFQEALDSLRDALSINPNHHSALSNLANCLEESLQFDEALVHYRKLAELDPCSVEAHTRVLHRLALSSAVDPESLFLEHCRVGRIIEHSERDHRRPHDNTRDGERVLRVGFVSADLTNHAVSYFVEPIFRGVAQRPDLALFAYHNNAAVTEKTERIRSHFLHWRTIDLLSDDDLDAQIRVDGIDILIDLSGYTEGNRLRLFARKPAPIQASWIGYPGTTGLTAMDYYLADREFLPGDVFASQFVEKLVYLPTTSMFEPSTLLPAVNALPAARGSKFTFGSFNRAAKLNHQTVALWARLLLSLPESRLIIGAMNNPRQVETLKLWFKQEGIDTARIDFRPRTDTQTYLQTYHEVDLCLDTHPYSGGTTTHHALLMGVPVLTLAGHTPPSRQGASLLAHLNLDDFVATSPEEFLRLGVDWARRRKELAQIRTGLRGRIESSPIQDVDLMARALAQALRRMWRRWCAHQTAEPIDVSQTE